MLVSLDEEYAMPRVVNTQFGYHGCISVVKRIKYDHLCCLSVTIDWCFLKAEVASFQYMNKPFGGDSYWLKLSFGAQQKLLKVSFGAQQKLVALVHPKGPFLPHRFSFGNTKSL